MKDFKIPQIKGLTVIIINSLTKEELVINERQLRYLQLSVVKGELHPDLFMINTSVYNSDNHKFSIEPTYLLTENGSVNPGIANRDLENMMQQTSQLSLELIKLQRGAK